MIKYIKSNPGEIIYFTQRNNAISPMRACFATSLAMALRNNGLQYKVVNNLQLDDCIMEIANGAKGKQWAKELGIPANTQFLNEWWSLMERLANDLLQTFKVPLRCKWTTTGSLDTIKKQIDAGVMPVMGTMLTASGHVVTASGYTDNSIILCDPYGNANTHYTDANGMNVELTPDKLNKITKNMLLFEKV
jgi:uncharacterized protein YvpB